MSGHSPTKSIPQPTQPAPPALPITPPSTPQGLYSEDAIQIIVVDNDSPREFTQAMRRVVASPNTRVESVRPSGYEIGALQVL